jgi:hypothetical protein
LSICFSHEDDAYHDQIFFFILGQVIMYGKLNLYNCGIPDLNPDHDVQPNNFLRIK